ncbi:hypothetical protein J1605_003452 [Eschrichtius robustus]|uniref:Uncharacterized protein n=1 Tax=Eschrichtius robustus TaxID=9764 RepID=A0AB34HMF4_ESCRO|nr:hypothetical protein J1605_003452 [Eschrichtius robustus]
MLPIKDSGPSTPGPINVHPVTGHLPRGTVLDTWAQSQGGFMGLVCPALPTGLPGHCYGGLIFTSPRAVEAVELCLEKDNKTEASTSGKGHVLGAFSVTMVMAWLCGGVPSDRPSVLPGGGVSHAVSTALQSEACGSVSQGGDARGRERLGPHAAHPQPSGSWPGGREASLQLVFAAAAAAVSCLLTAGAQAPNASRPIRAPPEAETVAPRPPPGLTSNLTLVTAL